MKDKGKREGRERVEKERSGKGKKGREQKRDKW